MHYRALGWFALTFIVVSTGFIGSYIWPYLTSPVTSEAPLVVNDVTQLNPVRVTEVFSPRSENELVEKVKSSKGQISVGGGRFSQGGQVASEQSLHIDMRDFKKVIFFDAQQKLITVQSGIRWRDIQTYVDNYDLAIKIMQSYANFTVGGSLSVNAHGRYIGEGPIIKSDVSIKLLLANGDVVEATPSLNPELFYSAIGGYGGIAIILEATLQLTDNTKVERVIAAMPLSDYQQYFQSEIVSNNGVVFHNGILYPPEFTEVTAVSWITTDKPVTVEDRIHQSNKRYWWQPAITDMVAEHTFAKLLRQHLLDPIMLNRPAVHWRNYEASYDVRELEPHSREKYTYGLREYFVPVDKLPEFSADLAEIINQSDANVLNVSIRHAKSDPGSVLAWAKQEVFAFVVYYRQGTDSLAQEKTDVWSQKLIDAALKHGGTYYLPYQLSATAAQFCKAYPRAAEFNALKQQYDPQNRFSSKFWTKYLPAMNECASPSPG